MTERNNGFDPSQLERLGLYRKGEHLDETITIVNVLGENVELKVDPLKINGGTMFVPKRGQSNALEKLFPKNNGGAMFRNRE